MQIMFINNDGGGFADQITITPGTTVGQLFDRRMHGAPYENYTIRVNREPCTASQELKEGDRVSITPRKIEGAN